MLRILTLLLLLLPVSLNAQEIIQEVSQNASQNDPYHFITQSKDLKHTFSGKIDKIIDGQTLLLQDGQIIRLSGLDSPSDAKNPDFDFGLAAKNWLAEHLPHGRDVMIYQTRKAEKGRKNRMGHALGHILTKNYKTQQEEIKPFWVQEKLLAQGLARVYTSPSNPQLYKEMLLIEDQARQKSIGLWADNSPFKRITPKDAPQYIGQFVVLEAPILKSASVNNKLFFNFGDNWKTDFTIMLSTAQRKQLSRQGISPTSLAGQRIRVRGWLREYNGPLIELETLEHLEVLGPNSPLPEAGKAVNLAQ